MNVKTLLSACIISGLAFTAQAEMPIKSEQINQIKNIQDMSKQEREAYIESLTEKEKEAHQKTISAEGEQLETIKAKPAILEDQELKQQKIETMDNLEMPTME